ncbi:MAG: NADH-quinone oxidoreductase subunit NuoE [Pelagibacteraceae bacterium]|nr:NADH-quinone oxidoreductase subunit NuoE [Pelagibacteraceae bacterium]|tara:strand:+ start:2860 stop:3456 length:597 start_codon:yes stop_codon:yes gene_type:complete
MSRHPGLINKTEFPQPDNFSWTEENLRKIDKIIDKYPKKRIQSAVIPILDLAQKQNGGWLSQKAIEKVAKTLSMSIIRVMEVATFYSMFNLEPVGKNFVQICRTTPCWLRGSDKLTKIAKKFTKCELGQLSEDKLFTIVEVECLGACCNAPMVQINNDYYEDLNENILLKILEDLKNNKDVKSGSQIGRINSKPLKQC